MTQELPLVVGWDTFPRDISDPKRFQLSRFNYLYKNDEARLIMGYWEAEQGVEVIGEMVGGGTADEIMIVLEGQLHVSTPGEPERVARVGDLVVCLRDRETRVEVRERTRVFFVVQGIEPATAERVMRGLQQP